jgi:hypothetical protein
MQSLSGQHPAAAIVCVHMSFCSCVQEFPAKIPATFYFDGALSDPDAFALHSKMVSGAQGRKQSRTKAVAGG